MLTKLLWLSVAGTAGTLVRFALGGLVQRTAGGAFPWGTLAVNSLGCFLFGFVWTIAEERFLISAETRTVLLIGFMGAFTTFSTFAFETGQMLRDAQWLTALGNVAAQNVAGLLALFAGFAVGRML